jgi:FlaA1/EpsC-like NDP-sugar epimerase
MTVQGKWYWADSKPGGKSSRRHMNTSITKKLAGAVALVTGGSRCIGAAIVRRLAADGADVASVFVTNGGYNGVQQVLKLSTRLSPNCDKRPIQNRDDDSGKISSQMKHPRR